MNAREAMQALLEGETVYCWSYGEIHKFRLSDDGVLLSWRDTPGRWEATPWLLNSIEGVYEEYPLTFEQALREMLDGKVVEVERLDPNLRFRYRFNHNLSCFEHYSTSDGRWWATHISECEQICKWKVVE